MPSYADIVTQINAYPAVAVVPIIDSLSFELYNGTPDNKSVPYSHPRDFIFTPALMKTPRKDPKYFILPDFTKTSQIYRRRECLKSYLEGYSIYENADKSFMGSENLVLCTFKSKRIVIMIPLRDASIPKQANTTFILPITHYASIMFTNNYVHGIVPIAESFPKCAHIHLIDRTCYVQYYDLILDVFDVIEKTPKIYNPLYDNDINIINAPSLPHVIRRDSMIGAGVQGSVHQLDDKRVIKITNLALPSGFATDYDLNMGERDAINEVLIMYYLKSRKFKHSPAPLSFGYFNSIFFYIIMERIDGKQPADEADYELCQRSVDELHKMGVLHTDLHAGNLLIRDTKTNCILLDFGFANLKNKLPESFKDEIYYQK